MVLLGVVRVVVDAQHERDVGVAGRSRDHDLLRTGGQVLPRSLAVSEKACRLDDDLHSAVGPGKRRRISLREHLERAPVDSDLAAAGLDFGVEDAVRGVVLEHVREHIGVGEVVDRDDLEARFLLQIGAVEVAPDAAEAVDAHPGRHRAESNPPSGGWAQDHRIVV